MRYLCHDQPDLLEFEAEVLDLRSGAVLLSRSAFHPGGGGQLADQGWLKWRDGSARVIGLELQPDGLAWHLLDSPSCPAGTAVHGQVDPGFRRQNSLLHTGLHILNALVFQRFQGALVTGAQIAADGTARHDFDLAQVDNARLKSLEQDLNDIIRKGREVRSYWMPMGEAVREPGLIRSKSVAPPPTADGQIRIVEIVGLDRQACGGTHLRHTGESGPLRILKVDNKGRHNRRVYIGLAQDP